MHAERLNPMLPQYQLLSSINIPQANVDQLLQTDEIFFLQPSKDILSVLLGKPTEKRNGHAVNIATLAGLWRIDIRMCIHPDHGHFSAQSLPYSLRGASDRANGNRVVSPKCQDAASFLRMFVHLVAELLRHGRDSKRVLHAAIIGVGGREEVFVGMYGVIVIQFVAQVLAELGQQAVRDEGRWSCIDAWFALCDC